MYFLTVHHAMVRPSSPIGCVPSIYEWDGVMDGPNCLLDVECLLKVFDYVLYPGLLSRHAESVKFQQSASGLLRASLEVCMAVLFAGLPAPQP